MLTIDDANAIKEKYKSGFWYQIDCSDFDISSFPTSGLLEFRKDSFKIEFTWHKTTTGLLDVRLYLNTNSFATRLIYLTYNDGTVSSLELDYWPTFVKVSLEKETFEENPFIFNVFITSNPTNLPDNIYLYRCLFLPVSPLQIPVVNGEFDDKLYIDVLGDSITAYTLDGNVVTLNEDSKGKYFTLPSANDCIIGTKYNAVSFPLYRVVFHEFKTLPIPYIPSLYRGTPQTIQVINSDTEEPITEFQAYYQGRLLQGNQITLPYDADDYVDIVVDLNDPNYPNSTLKLKAPTMIYQANTKSEVKTAIENGIQTLQVGDNETKVSLNDMELTNIALINSNIKLTECALTDCRIINTQYMDKGKNTFNNVNIETSTITSTETNTIYNECTLNECTLTNTELHITGKLTENTFTNSLIISDGVITIQDNTFNGIGYKTYFPSYLYLTGEYTTIGNTFNLTGEWTELTYNMCIIKATNEFNQSVFINNNTFNLNITYEDEPTNTLYYNIVDDDKIRAVRLQ